MADRERKRHTALRLPIPLRERLRQIARLEQISTSELMRHALRTYCEQYEEAESH